jgi:outer membrane murein-binding lipoprotein Lpp
MEALDDHIAELRAQIARLNSERDEARMELAQCHITSKICEDCDPLTYKDVEQLRADLSAARQDAERLETLRRLIDEGYPTLRYVQSGDALNGLIDAAALAAGEKGGDE